MRPHFIPFAMFTALTMAGKHWSKWMSLKQVNVLEHPNYPIIIIDPSSQEQYWEEDEDEPSDDEWNGENGPSDFATSRAPIVTAWTPVGKRPYINERKMR